MKKRLLSVMLVFVLLTSVLTPLAGAITENDMQDATALTLGEQTPVNVATVGSYAYMSYTPAATCRYALYSAGNTDTVGYLYDSSGNELASDDNDGENNNFLIEYTLTADETYYFAAGFADGNTMGGIFVTLEQIHDWSDWVSDENGKHTRTCSLCSAEESEDCVYETVLNNGVKKTTCSVCGHSFTQEVSGETTIGFWGFENNTDGWTFIDADGDGYNWFRATSGNTAYEGVGTLHSESYNSSGALSPDNWAISPAFDLTGCTDPMLTLKASGKQDTNSYYKEIFALYAGTSPDPDDMQKMTDDITTENQYRNYQVDLSAYEGASSVHIAIRHYNVYDMYYLDVDNVEITASLPAVCDAHQLVAHPANAEATCTDGVHDTPYWQCSVCGRTYSDAAGEHPVLLSDVVTTPALGHLWGDPVSDNNGTHTYTCTRCNDATKTEDCTYKDNRQENGVAKRECKKCDYQYYEEVTGWQTVAFWDFEKDDEGWTYVDADGDGYTWERDKGEAFNGSYSIASKYNDEKSVDNWAISPAFSLSHVDSARLSVQIKRDSAEYAETFALYAGTTPDPDEMTAISQDYNAQTDYVNYTAELTDYLGEPVVYIAIRHYDCVDSYYLYADNVEITAELPAVCETHQLVKVPAAEATCTMGAHPDYWQCETCGRTFSDDAGEHPVLVSDLITAPALGHLWGNWAETTPATCTQKGVKTSVCSRCNAERTKSIPALGHKLGSPVSNHDGTHSRYCARCDYSETEDCTYEEAIADGVKKTYCTKCGDAHFEEISGSRTIALWDFEKNPADWTFVDADGDGFCWQWVKDDEYFMAHSGTGLIRSASYINGTGALTPENWAISPAFSLEGCTDAAISVYAGGTDSEYFSEVFAFYAGTSPDPESMTKVAEDITTVSNEYAEYTADLSDFAGEPVVYIAVLHYNCTDEYWLRADDVKVTGTFGDPCSEGDHNLTAVPAVQPTETEDGNIAYYVCDTCGRYYLDADGTQPVTPDAVVLPALGYAITVADDIENGRLYVDKERAHEGETVTLTPEPGSDFIIAVVTYSDGTNTYAISPADGVYSFKMPDGPVTVSAEFTDVGATLAGHTLSLDGDIGVNFYMELTENVLEHQDTAYMLFTIPAGSSTETKKVYVKDARQVTIDDKKYYVFKCGVSAKDMASVITAQLINGDKSGPTYEYSVTSYAYYLLAHTDVPEYASAAELVAAMLNYGAYAQKLFNVNTDNLANAGLPEAAQNLAPFSPEEFKFPYDNSQTVLPEGVTFEKVTLSLKSETTLSLYFKSDKELTFACQGKTVDTEKVGEYQVARIRGISAQELPDAFTLSITAGSDQGSVTYSPMNYCYNVLVREEDGTDLKNVVTALGWYAMQAYYYFYAGE